MSTRSDSIGDLMRFNAARFECVDGGMDATSQAAAIRRNYELHRLQVSAGVSDWDFGSPYDIADWAAVLTPVEFGAWQDIRSAGLPLWPRLSVGDLVVSFGHPAARVALLCGAVPVHTDHWLAQTGWRVFRASDSQCTRVMDSPADVRERTGEVSDEYRARYLTETLAGTMQDLRHALIAAQVPL